MPNSIERKYYFYRVEKGAIRLRKLSAIAAGVLSLSVILAGCQSSGGSSNASSGSSGSTVSLNFLQNKPEVVAEWNNLIKAFEKQNPNIQLTQINPPNTDTTLQADLAKGQMPDVIAMGADATFIQMATNKVFKDLTGASELNQISPAYTKMLENEVGSTTPYALPYTVNAVSIIYNVDLFNQYHLTVPTTWDELMKDADKIKAAGGTPFYNGYKDAWTIAPLWNALAANSEPSTFQHDLTGGTASFANNDVTAMNRLKQFVTYGQSNQFGVDYNDANTAFANGKAVFYAQGIWTIPVIRAANPSIKLNAFAVPMDDPSKTVMVSGVDSLLTITNSGNAAKEAAAMKFIDFLLEPSNAKEYAQAAGLYSTVTGAQYTDDALTATAVFH